MLTLKLPLVARLLTNETKKTWDRLTIKYQQVRQKSFDSDKFENLQQFPL